MTTKDEPPFREALVKNADSVTYRPRNVPEYWVNLERENKELRAENERLTLDNRRLTEMWDTDRESLTAEIERWKAQCMTVTSAHEHRVELYAELHAENERLRAALKEYADFENWVGATGPMGGELSGWCGAGKGWETAQSAL